MICVTRYRRDPSKPHVSQRRAFPSLSRQAPSVRRGHRRTPWMEPATPTGPPNRDLEPVAAPWGEADDVHPETNAGWVASPARTRQLTSWARTERTGRAMGSPHRKPLHRLNIVGPPHCERSRQDRLYRGRIRTRRSCRLRRTLRWCPRRSSPKRDAGGGATHCPRGCPSVCARRRRRCGDHAGGGVRRADRHQFF